MGLHVGNVLAFEQTLLLFLLQVRGHSLSKREIYHSLQFCDFIKVSSFLKNVTWCKVFNYEVLIAL